MVATITDFSYRMDGASNTVRDPNSSRLFYGVSPGYQPKDGLKVSSGRIVRLNVLDPLSEIVWNEDSGGSNSLLFGKDELSSLLRAFGIKSADDLYQKGVLAPYDNGSAIGIAPRKY